MSNTKSFYIFDHILDDKACDSIIKTCMRNYDNFQPCMVGINQGATSVKASRKVRRCMEQVYELQGEIYDTIFDQIQSQVPKVMGNDGKHMLLISHLARNAKFMRYKKGGKDHFAEHTDTSEVVEIDGKKYSSQMTVLIYLNNLGNYSGSTRLYTNAEYAAHEDIFPNTGKCLVFYHQIPHEASQINADANSDKYVLKTRLFYEHVPLDDEKQVLKIRVGEQVATLSNVMIKKYFPQSLFGRLIDTLIPIDRDQDGNILFKDRNETIFFGLIVPYLNLNLDASDPNVMNIVLSDQNAIDQEFKIWGLASPIDIVHNIENRTKFTTTEVDEMSKLLDKLQLIDRYQQTVQSRFTSLFKQLAKRGNETIFIPLFHKYTAFGELFGVDKQLYQDVKSKMRDTHIVQLMKMRFVHEDDHHDSADIHGTNLNMNRIYTVDPDSPSDNEDENTDDEKEQSDDEKYLYSSDDETEYYKTQKSKKRYYTTLTVSDIDTYGDFRDGESVYNDVGYDGYQLYHVTMIKLEPKHTANVIDNNNSTSQPQKQNKRCYLVINTGYEDRLLRKKYKVLLNDICEEEGVKLVHIHNDKQESKDIIVDDKIGFESENDIKNNNPEGVWFRLRRKNQWLGIVTQVNDLEYFAYYGGGFRTEDDEDNDGLGENDNVTEFENDSIKVVRVYLDGESG